MSTSNIYRQYRKVVFSENVSPLKLQPVTTSILNQSAPSLYLIIHGRDWSRATDQERADFKDEISGTPVTIVLRDDALRPIDNEAKSIVANTVRPSDPITNLATVRVFEPDVGSNTVTQVTESDETTTKTLTELVRENLSWIVMGAVAIVGLSMVLNR
jgi:hypothetical protein